jgi:hypothetical protein
MHLDAAATGARLVISALYSWILLDMYIMYVTGISVHRHKTICSTKLLSYACYGNIADLQFLHAIEKLHVYELFLCHTDAPAYGSKTFKVTLLCKAHGNHMYLITAPKIILVALL